MPESARLSDGVQPGTSPILLGVDSHSLTPEQARKLRERLAPMLDYLNKLATRIQRRGFPDDDPLRTRAKAARDAMLSLLTEVRLLRR